MMPEARQRRTELQWLRAFAASEVVLVHSDLVTKHVAPDRLISQSLYVQWFGGIGVEIFFVLSGYIMCMIAPSASSPGTFLISRIRRLYPMYWVFTSLVVLTWLVKPSYRLNNFEPNIATFLTSYLILPEAGFPILGVGWTLEHEMLFYAAVTVAILAWRRSAARPGLGWGLAALGLAGCLMSSNPPSPGSWTNDWLVHVLSPYMLAFAAGWLLCSLEHCSLIQRRAGLVIFAAILAVGWYAGPSWGGWISLRISVAAAIVAGVIACRAMFREHTVLGRLATRLGDASYSIYLSHWLVMSAIGKILGVIYIPAATSDILRLCGIIIAMTVGQLTYTAIERPVDLWLRGRRKFGPRAIKYQSIQ